MLIELPNDLQRLVINRLDQEEKKSLRQVSCGLCDRVDECALPSESILLKAYRRAWGHSWDSRPSPNYSLASEVTLAHHLEAALEQNMRRLSRAPPRLSATFYGLRSTFMQVQRMVACAAELEGPSTRERAVEVLSLQAFIRSTPPVLQRRLEQYPDVIPQLHAYETRRQEDIKYMSLNAVTSAVMYGFDAAKRPFLALRGISHFESQGEVVEAEKERPSVAVFFQHHYFKTHWAGLNAHHPEPEQPHRLFPREFIDIEDRIALWDAAVDTDLGRHLEDLLLSHDHSTVWIAPPGGWFEDRNIIATTRLL